MFVVDPKTGKDIGKQKVGGLEAFSSPIYADGKIFYSARSGLSCILEPTEKGLKIVHRVRLSGELIHGSPIVSHGRLYIPTSGALYCIGNKDQTPVPPDPRPTQTPETPTSADRTPARLQITPVESLLGPGLWGQEFSIRLFNANGRYLSAKDAQVTYELKGPGKLEKAKFSAPRNSGPAVSFVTAKVGNLTSTARIRTVPDLSWSFDFSDGKVPETWIGSAYRHIVIDDDLLSSLKGQDPRAGQLYIYLTTKFTNVNATTIKIQDAGPRPDWTDFLRYFDLTGEGKPSTVEECKKQFEAGLDLLAKEKVIDTWEFSQDAAGELTLAVSRGPRKITGNAVMCKISTIPKGTRSQGWMGHTFLHDYTIQADLKGTSRHGKLPSMGLIDQRYTLALEGAAQELQIRSWVSRLDLRFAKTMPFEWKPDVWYTLKFQSENKDGKAILRGKAWVRGQSEPGEWTIEAADETPNVNGSPGLFGNASDAEVFIDNVKVNAN
ncbi:MAG TPA: pyrrolo-quinoline quinone, partial [Planctomycetaceae bacterium]|nr:pyrrolo-quinoline quinone [Planctomycetaceae bacterium]